LTVNGGRVRLTAMPDFVAEKTREINARLKELRPLVEEFHRLEAAAAALEGLPSGGAVAGVQLATTRRPRPSSSDGAGAKRGRPRGSGARSRQAIELVRARPGITIPEMAGAMGIRQNYLYRLLPSLQQEGVVRKEGRGWHPLEAA
jgi:hypothetical protein